MLLIADSGSTKTDWRLVEEGKVLSYSTIGFNPYHISEQQIINELESSDLVKKSKDVSKVFFYGAGCSSNDKKEVVKSALNKIFINAVINIEHDLLAAARATCGKKPGMTAILGTGSNSCLYDGENITVNIPALGYILGDDGGGVDMGKDLIKKYLSNELPNSLKDKFDKKYNLSHSDILDAVYKKPLPNRFLAQFTKFIKENENEPVINTLIEHSFQKFFSSTICKYPNFKNYKLNTIGSIAEVFNKQLQKVALNNQVELGENIKKPIEKLVLFHTRN